MAGAVVATFALIALAFHAPIALAANDPFAGSWRALSNTPPGRGLIQLDIERVPGEETYRVGLRGQEAEFHYSNPPPPLDRPLGRVRDGVLHHSAPFYFSSVIGYTSGTVDLRARRDGDALAVDLQDEGVQHTFRFLPASDPSFARFETPRLEESGKPVLSYAYTPPGASDGLDPAAAGDLDIAVAPLQAMVHSVLDGSSPWVTSLLLMKDGKLVLEEYFHGLEPDRLHIMMSVTKSFTSMLFGIALERGDLDSIDRPVMEFLPEYAHTRWARDRVGVTARHLLRMANVLGWREFTPVLPGETRRDRAVIPLVRMLLEDDGLEFLFEQPVITDHPDPYYSYNTSYTEILGAVLQSRVGDLEAYAAKHLFEPLGIDTFFWGATAPNAGKPRHEDGRKAAGAALFLSPRTMARVGRVVLEGGVANGRQIVPRAWIEESTAVHAIQSEPYQTYGAGDGYGYHWWVLKHGPPAGTAAAESEPIWVAAARGHGGQKIFLIPAYDAVFVTTALNYRDPFQTDQLLRRFVLPALAGGGEAARGISGAANLTGDAPAWRLLAVSPDEIGHRVLGGRHARSAPSQTSPSPDSTAPGPP